MHEIIEGWPSLKLATALAPCDARGADFLCGAFGLIAMRDGRAQRARDLEEGLPHDADGELGGRVQALVGHWPDDAWMTFDRSREGERLGRGIYRWAGERWREVRRHRHETRGLFTPRDITFSWRGTTFFGTYADGEARLCGLLSFGEARAPFATSGCSPDLLERGDRGPSPPVLRSSGTSRPARPGAAWPCLVPARRPETAAPSANFA